nr:ribosomal protein S7 [Navicula sp.]
MNKNKLKRKTINHILKNGKKQISEKILKNSVKSVQKFQKKSHNEILKLAIFNSMPTFRIIKLKRRKSLLEIPAYLSSYKYRASWGLKYLTKTLTSNSNLIFYKQLKTKILSNASSTNETAKPKDEVQKNVLKKKKYFKHYRW